MDDPPIDTKVQALNQLISKTTRAIHNINDDAQTFFTVFYIANKCKILSDAKNQTIRKLSNIKKGELDTIVKWYNENLKTFEDIKKKAIDKYEADNKIISNRIEAIISESSKLWLELGETDIKLNEALKSKIKADLETELNAYKSRSSLNNKSKDDAKIPMSSAEKTGTSFNFIKKELRSVTLNADKSIKKLDKEFEELIREQSKNSEIIKLIKENNFVIKKKIEKIEDLFLKITSKQSCGDGKCSMMGGKTRRKHKHANKKKKTKRRRTKRS